MPVGDPWFPENGLMAINLLPDGGVQVIPIPEPSTILLLGAGLAGTAVFGRKKFWGTKKA